MSGAWLSSCMIYMHQRGCLQGGRGGRAPFTHECEGGTIKENIYGPFQCSLVPFRIVYERGMIRSIFVQGNIVKLFAN